MDEENKKEESTKSSNAAIYSVFLIVLVLASGAAFYFGRKSGEAKMIAFYQSQPKPSTRPSGPPNFKGQKLSDIPMGAQATLIYPGVVSASAKAIMVNWTLKTANNSDGTVTASLIPEGSEAAEGDTMHTFTLKTGDKLYFVDLNPNDDQPGMDQNTHDDLGIVVDANGIIQ